jgi:hypothetical protein
MDFVFILIGFFILYIFLFSRKLLIHKTFSIVLWGLCLLLFVTGFLLDGKGVRGSEAFKIPLLQYSIYMLFRYLFVKLYNREPKDTFWTMEKGVWKDAIFNIIFWLVAFLLPTIIVFTGII